MASLYVSIWLGTEARRAPFAWVVGHFFFSTSPHLDRGSLSGLAQDGRGGVTRRWNLLCGSSKNPHQKLRKQERKHLAVTQAVQKQQKPHVLSQAP